MNASEAIARLRELRATATAGPWDLAGDEQTEWAAFVTGPSGKPVGEIYPDNAANAAAIVAAMNSLESLLACAEAVQKIHDHLSDYIDARKTVDVSVAVAFETSRAALQALAEGGGE
jgi:hypothetical protein